MKFSPYRMAIAAARGLLKASSSLRRKANEAFNVKVADLVLRFENPEVYKLLKEFDKDKKYLIRNIEGAKKILGLIEE